MLTYYGILSIFPMLIALISILGLIGTSATQPLIDNLGKALARHSRSSSSAIEPAAQPGRGGRSPVTSAWSAFPVVCVGLRRFMRASNAIYDVGGR